MIEISKVNRMVIKIYPFKKMLAIYSLFFFLIQDIQSQSKQLILTNDSMEMYYLEPIMIKATHPNIDLERLDPVKGTYLFAGKKNEVILLSQKQFAHSEKYARQIFSKVPGVFVYDMDGTGNQMNISTRGLDPHRSWEFNIRKDGILTNSDMYGYPASHYNIPMEAVERIELVRGAASLQYGAQFGGLLNYVSKKPDTSKILAYDGTQSAGTFGMFSTFNRLSGKSGKISYSAWMNRKTNEGYRKNGDSKFSAEGISLFFDWSKHIQFNLEWTHSDYTTHLAGPLTDSMFYENPRQSTRSRNYYNPDIHIPSFKMNWNLSENTKLYFTSSAVLGYRNSAMFDKPTSVPDTLNLQTLLFNNRQVDIDAFNSYTSELRLLHAYPIFHNQSQFSAGIQVMKNKLHRQQLGKGTTGNDFDLTLVEPGFGRDLFLKTENFAAFFENQWRVTHNFFINLSFRLELGKTNMDGKIIYYQDSLLPNKIQRKFPLFGMNFQYDLTNRVQIYGGWAQSYRPVIFKDIIPASLYETVDRDLEDAKGDQLDLGFRGSYHSLKWDFSAFRLNYRNRMGIIVESDPQTNFNIFRTNIGNSISQGIELFLQWEPKITDRINVYIYNSSSFIDATYHNAFIRSGNENISIDGNKVESVPEWIIRNGIQLKYKKFGFSALHSYTSESFADPANTVLPDKNGAVGIVPAYHLFDLNFDFRYSKALKFLLNINNLLDKQHFTKRPQFYPGPGIWPSDGRTISGSIVIHI